MARTCLTIILAAGEGTRMRSQLPKVLHPVAGLPMVCHVIRTASAAGGDAFAVVTGNRSQEVQAAVSAITDKVSFYEQRERLGTAHAVLAAREALERGYDDILVLFGDTPLTRPETLKRMRRGLELGAEVAVLGFHAEDPTGYGRLIERDGELVAIREHREADSEELRINFCNGGIMAFAGRNAAEMLDAIGNANSKGEYYLTDLVEVARERKLKVVAMEAGEDEILGVNNRAELARAEAIWQVRRRSELMADGVSMRAPETVFLNEDTAIGADCMIEPNVVFGPGVVIGEGVTIRAFSHLEGCRIETGAIVGPFARIRPGTELGQNVHVGNFCELKNAKVSSGAKVNHLSYVGDATIGAGSNIGAGTITCNYDGVGKYLTEIGSNAFVGSNSSLVAPVRIGDGAYVASGSVITEAVPDGSMAVARGRQANKEGYAALIRERAKARKEQAK
ncbi:MAG: bifunctional UDP-N-acetylglucosamine diphosphorylase/glucosamine-1-phosphate N-acetyltransferase GlmU [Nitratireductor sp.]|nr:bifunctional UDP-N-acetylglucosamine diphosphorylase/glucosamine-1-phosphate N-acetyltransferase GlmU [Nitratireductor sp.]